MFICCFVHSHALNVVCICIYSFIHTYGHIYIVTDAYTHAHMNTYTYVYRIGYMIGYRFTCILYIRFNSVVPVKGTYIPIEG